MIRIPGREICLAVGLIAPIPACQTVPQLESVLAGPCPAPVVDTSAWVSVSVGDVSLRLPAELVRRETTPIDSRAASFATGDGRTLLDVDYGFAPDPLADRESWSAVSRCSEEIGGRTAGLVAARSLDPRTDGPGGPLVVGAYWRDVRPGLHLTVMGFASDATWQSRLLAVLRTVELVASEG